MSNQDERALNFWQRMGYSIGNSGVGLLPAIVGSWAMYYYSPPPEDGSCLVSYVPVYLIGLMLAIGRVAEALLNPFIGDWSDKTNTRWGRRIPYILIGTPIMVLAMFLIWFPPIGEESLINAAWVCFWMSIVSMSFAAVVAPYLSLLPELTPYNDERLTVSAMMALFEVLGVLTATAGAGLLINEYKCGVDVVGSLQLNGFQIAGLLFGVLTLIAFYVTAFTVKEKPYTPSKKVELSFVEGFKQVWKNESFSPYLYLVTAFRIGVDLVVVAIPYMITTVMRGTEGDAAVIQLIVLLGSVVLFPAVNWASVRFGKKIVTLVGCLGFMVILPLMMFIGLTDRIPLMTQAYILFGFATIPVAIFNVLPRPLLADVIDYDEKRTGLRREAMYNGVEGLFTRSASGFAWLLSSLLFHFFGNSAENPLGIQLVGPVGAVFIAIAFFAFRKYPFKE